jgi:hypothetical protein
MTITYKLHIIQGNLDDVRLLICSITCDMITKNAENNRVRSAQHPRGGFDTMLKSIGSD